MISPANLDEMVPIVCNTDDEVIFANVRSAVKRSLPWLGISDPHDGVAVIVGGGPSMKALLPMIAGHQNAGHKVFALNGVTPTLKSVGVIPDYFVLLDAREENRRFVHPDRRTHNLIASQCPPCIFDDLAGYDVTLWHPRYEGIEEHIGPGRYALIGGGSTVGLQAMCVAYALGYRTLHLYGFDSSYAPNGEGHAYPQSMNDGDERETLHVAGRKFEAAPWMTRQAMEFQTIAADLAQDDTVIHVHGSGLLPAVANAMSAGYAIERKAEGKVAFVCVNIGTKYPMKYVDTLYDMVRHNVGFRKIDFYCITDRPDELPRGVTAIEHNPDLPGWWQKVRLFSDDMPWQTGQRIVYLDLDVVVTSTLDRLIDTPGIISDWNWPTFNSSVMVWDHGEHRAVWERFTPDVIEKPGAIVPQECLPGTVNGGDQEWITQVVKSSDEPWPCFSPEMCVSYRGSAVDEIPVAAMVVVFHGDPKPHEAGGWVPKYWKSYKGIARHGVWWWPASDTHASQVVMADAEPAISALLPYIDGRKCIVQAGGNVGVYPALLAQTFDTVVTVEPDDVNYECMRRNLTNCPNVVHKHAAFGAEPGVCNPVHLDETNCGAHLVDFTDGNVPVLRIDDMGLTDCDAIWLDVEGSELLALQGAERTIEQFSPVIAVEDKGLNEAFGVEDGALQAWLSERGYEQVGAYGRDKIFKRKVL